LPVMVLVLLFAGCSIRKSTSVYFKTDKRKMLLGDSVKVEWKVRKSKNITGISLNNSITNLPFTGDTVLKIEQDTVFELLVYSKRKERPFRRIRKVKVRVPEIIAFGAFRDRSDPFRVILSWETRNVTNLSIEGYKYDLPEKGSDTLDLMYARSFNLIAKTPFTSLTKTCYVDGLPGRPTYIKNDTAIFQLSADHKITFKITETDTWKYPEEVKVKVIAYDSLGNFITHLAPPFGDSVTARKYFRKVIEKAGTMTREIEFEVKEFHEPPDLYDIALTLDYSGSMTPCIDTLEKAIQSFIREKYPDDQYSVIKYDGRLVEVCGLLKKEEELIDGGSFNGIDTLGGSTALYAGIDKGLRTLENSLNKKIVLLFTDGKENSSIYFLGEYAATINEVIRAVRSQQAKMLIAGLGDVNVRLLNELAYYTNGTFYHLEEPADILEVYKELQHNLRTYYEVTIRPIKHDGEHLLQLTYFDNQKIRTTERPYYIGDDIDLAEFEEDTSAYWFDKKIKDQKYNLALSPQIIVNYDFDKDNIKKEYFNPILKITNFLKNNPLTLIRIYGHTDSKGNDDYNLKLSAKRAESVRQYLIKQKISPARISCFGMGEKEPIWNNDDDDWSAAENRRVEIVIWKKGK